MKLHTRRQGTRFSFRLRLSNGYIDAAETYDTEEDAAFAADLGKHYLRTFFFVSKNTEASLDGEIFSMLAHRNNINLSDKLSVLAKLSPGVVLYLDNHRAYLEHHAEVNRPERTVWQAFRSDPSFTSNPAIREWVVRCELAEQDVKDFSAVNSTSFFLRMSVVERGVSTALNSLGMAIKLHDGVENPRLTERKTRLLELQAHLQATSEHIKFLSAQFESESRTVFSALANLEAARPALV